jgi:predicted GNAT family acetyltransferase
MPETTDPGAAPVVHNESAQRFELNLNAHLAVLTYRMSNGTILFDHTEVPPEIEGRGVASKLTQAALEFARSKNLRVVPLCWFVATYIDKHAEHQDLLARST